MNYEYKYDIHISGYAYEKRDGGSIWHLTLKQEFQCEKVSSIRDLVVQNYSFLNLWKQKRKQIPFTSRLTLIGRLYMFLAQLIKHKITEKSHVLIESTPESYLLVCLLFSSLDIKFDVALHNIESLVPRNAQPKLFKSVSDLAYVEKIVLRQANQIITICEKDSKHISKLIDADKKKIKKILPNNFIIKKQLRNFDLNSIGDMIFVGNLRNPPTLIGLKKLISQTEIFTKENKLKVIGDYDNSILVQNMLGNVEFLGYLSEADFRNTIMNARKIFLYSVSETGILTRIPDLRAIYQGEILLNKDAFRSEYDCYQISYY